MKLLIIFIAISCIFASVSYSEITTNNLDFCENQDCCESCNFLYKDSGFDSTKHFVIAKYCMYYDIQKDSALKLLLYEQIIPPTIKIQKECLNYSFSGTIGLEPDNILFNRLFGGTGFCRAISIHSEKKMKSVK